MTEPDNNKCIFDWLKEFFNSRIEYERQIVDEREKRYMALFENNEKAVIIALTAINNRLDLLNESRSSIADIVSNNPTRVEIQSSFDSMSKELKNINARLDRNEGSGVGKNAIWIYLVAGIGTVSIIVTLILTLVKRV